MSASPAPSSCVKISFAQNRRVHNLWQNALPSRFIDELPEANVEVEPMSTSYGGYGLGSFGGSRFDDVAALRQQLFDARLAARQAGL